MSPSSTTPRKPRAGLLKAKLKEMGSSASTSRCSSGARKCARASSAIAGPLTTTAGSSAAITWEYEDGQDAIAASLKARKDWAHAPWHERAAVFLKAAELLAGPYRPVLNAATMLCQSKSAYQAEIDSACELTDFWRYNPRFAEQIYETQPRSSRGVWNYVDYRPLEGFVFAVTPFNFTAIAGNLPTAPALMGNTVVWKPAAGTMYTAHTSCRSCQGRSPDGVINLVWAPPRRSAARCSRPDLAGIRFTGSTGVFNWMEDRGRPHRLLQDLPRLVGETGRTSSSRTPLRMSTSWPRPHAGRFRVWGQKCSGRLALHRTRCVSLRKLEVSPGSRWATRRTSRTSSTPSSTGTPTNPSRPTSRKQAKNGARILFGGKHDSEGLLHQATVILASKPDFKTMCEEIFGPVLTVYVYPAKKFEETLRICDKTSPYALTGAVLAEDRKAVQAADEILRNAAGNFYINDKPTGAVVGQQPFGGARASGTNDKAGSFLNLIRWTSPRTVKENFLPPKDFAYPFMAEE